MQEEENWKPTDHLGFCSISFKKRARLACSETIMTMRSWELKKFEFDL